MLQICRTSLNAEPYLNGEAHLSLALHCIAGFYHLKKKKILAKIKFSLNVNRTKGDCLQQMLAQSQPSK